MVGRPSRIVIGPLGVPQHDIAEAQLTARATANWACREHVCAVHAKSTGERPELTGRISGRDYHAFAFDHSLTGPQPDPVASGHDPPDLRPFEQLCAGRGGRAQYAETRAVWIELRTAVRADCA